MSLLARVITEVYIRIYPLRNEVSLAIAIGAPENEWAGINVLFEASDAKARSSFKTNPTQSRHIDVV